MTTSSESTTSTRVLLLGIWGHLTKRRRIQLGALLVVMLASSAAEVFSLAAVLPFLAVLANPEQIWQMPVVQQIAPVLQITAADQLLKPVTLLFGIAAEVGNDLSCGVFSE